MVALGSIETLRAYERPRWLVDGPPGGGPWVDGVPGVHLVQADGTRTVVELDTAAEGAEQPLLQAALAAGAVREFGPVRPSLVELYRDVVSVPTEVAA